MILCPWCDAEFKRWVRGKFRGTGKRVLVCPICRGVKP